MKKKLNIIIPLLFFSYVCYILFIQQPKDRQNYVVYKNIFYSELYKGIILKKNVNRGIIKLKLSNQTNCKLSNSRNYLYSEPCMITLMTIGDSIYKPSNSDSIFLYKDTLVYYFVNGNIRLNE